MTACHSLKKLEAYEGKIQQEQQDPQPQPQPQQQQQQHFCHSSNRSSSG